MAIETIDIPLPDGSVTKAPLWATEVTLEEIYKNSNHLKDIKDAIEKLAKVDKKPKTVEDKLDELADIAKDQVKETKKGNEKSNLEEQERVIFLQKFRQDFKNEWNRNLRQKELYDRSFAENLANKLSNIFSTTFSDIFDKLSDAPSSFLSGDMVRFSSTIGSVVGLGGAAGMAAGLLEEYANSLVQLLNTGAGAGLSLLDLKEYSTNAGIDLDNFTKLVSENSLALSALGTSVNDGMREFGELSRTLRNNSEDLRQFGLSNTEYNEILLKEIDMRRLSGMREAEITDAVTESMNNLLFETSAVASITGQNKRDLLRARQEAMSDPAIASYLSTLGEEQKNSILSTTAFTKEKFGDLAEKLSIGFLKSMSSRIPLDAIGGLGEILSLAGEQGQAIRNMYSDFEEVYKTSSPEEAMKFLYQRMSTMQELDKEQEQMLRTIAETDGPRAEQARLILQFNNALKTMSDKTIEQVNTEFEKFRKNMENTPMAEFASSLEEAINSIKNSLIKTLFAMIGVGDELEGEERQKAIENALAEGLDSLTAMFEDKNLFEMFNDLGDGIKAITIAAGVAAAALYALGAAASFLALKGVIGGLGKGLFGRLAGTAAATGAGAATGSRAGASNRSTNNTTKGKGMLGNLFKKLGIVGTVYSAGTGIFDKDYTEAGYGMVDKAALGIAEGSLSFLDLLANTTNQVFGLDGLLGEANLAGSFKNKMIEPEVSSAMMFDSTNNITGIQTQQNDTTDNEPIMNQNNAIPGQKNISTFNEDGSLKPLEELIKELITATNEVARNQKKTTEAIESQ